MDSDEYNKLFDLAAQNKDLLERLSQVEINPIEYTPIDYTKILPQFEDYDISKGIIEAERNPIVSNEGIAESLKENLTPIIKKQEEMINNDQKQIDLLANQCSALDDNYNQLKKANKSLEDGLKLANSEIENNKKDIKAEGTKSTLSLIFTGLAFLVSVAALIVSIVK